MTPQEQMNAVEASKTLDGMVQAYNQLRAENNGHPISRSGRDLLYYHERAATTKTPKGDLVQAREAFHLIIADYVGHMRHTWSEEFQETMELEDAQNKAYERAVALIESYGLKADVSQQAYRINPILIWPRGD